MISGTREIKDRLFFNNKQPHIFEQHHYKGRKLANKNISHFIGYKHRHEYLPQNKEVNNIGSKKTKKKKEKKRGK